MTTMKFDIKKKRYKLLVLLVVVIAVFKIYSFCSYRNLTKYEIMDLGVIGDYGKVVALNEVGQVAGNTWNHAFFWDKALGMVDIGTLGGRRSEVSDINEAGQVVGWANIRCRCMKASSYCRDCTHAFYWDSKTGIIDLGTLGGKGSYAGVINNNGQVAGNSYTGDNKWESRQAFVWDNVNGMRNLNVPGATMSVVYGTNDNDEVFGKFEAADASKHAFIWDGKETTIGNIMPEMMEVFASNNRGQTTGIYKTNSGNWNALLFSSDGRWKNLGDGRGCAISNRGIVAGDTDRFGGETRAFIWDADKDKMTNLGTIPDIFSLVIENDSMASDVNDSGQVVGWVGRRWSEFGPGFVIYWDKDTGMVKLEKMLKKKDGWKRLISADCINNKGQIAGIGKRSNGKIHAFLMTPIREEEK